MPKFQYRALTQKGEVVSGSISAATASEVARRIEYLGLVPIEAVAGQGATISRMTIAFFSRPRGQDVTVFTRDLALLLRAGARLYDALDLLANDIDVGRLRPVMGQIKATVVAGESFAEAISRHPELFSAMYVALVRVGEASGTLDHILELLVNERVRAGALRRKLLDALQYPAFVLAAACGVLMFFLLFVLPQFSAVLRDFNAKLDPVVGAFLGLSDALHAHTTEMGASFALALIVLWLGLRRASVRASLAGQLSRLPFVRTIFNFYRSGLFCRNLGILLGSGVNLTATLRILVNIMSATGGVAVWRETADRVRHGGKLSEALAATSILPPMAVRMLRLGEETGQLAVLAGRVADFYEAKLQRSLDRIVGIAGPAAIIVISIVVGGLIVSVMTALLSVSQIIG
ncbi:MAG: type II secretion system F family protein [Pseudolabrys sp.]